MQKLTRRAEQRGAGVAARDGGDGRHHQVLDERARDDDAHRHVFALANSLLEESLGDVGLGNIKRRTLSVVLEVLGTALRIPLDRSAEFSTLQAGGTERLRKRNVLELVHLLVVDEDVLRS